MPIKEIERKIIKKMFSFAKELCNSDIPQFYELGHYLTDNLISKICIIIAMENDLKFTQKTKSGKTKTFSFYDLYNNILKYKYPKVPSFKKIKALHDQRNIYQHGHTSITHHLKKEFAQEYIKIAEEVLYKVQIITKGEFLTPTSYLAPISRDELETQKKIQEKDIKVQCINALHEICSYLYNLSFQPRSKFKKLIEIFTLTPNKFTGSIISALNLIKSHDALIQPLGITYLEKDITINSKTFVRILINANCNQNLEIIIDIHNIKFGRIFKYALDDNPVKDFKNISEILECLHSRI